MKRLMFFWCALLALFSPKLKPTAHASETHAPHGSHSRHTAFNSWHDFSFKIDDSKCRVGIASVKLSVSELKPLNGNLVATYSIHVPLKKSENDTGKIVLPIDVTVEDLHKQGGVLVGTAYSDTKGKTPNKIICEVGPNTTKGIILEIITDKRTLNFKSRYTVIEADNES
ncbi:MULTISPECIES: hypothetical protein [unclassified Lentimonas]|uniref:hypothetical protein n=1 Tax=unclassified Lentimonas TaxID=2630993 RepID=UPI001329994F|nr:MULTISPECIES: hypothetical protein [unclassified Lentimonas]CAA6678214.1 Unannotated [Lentimonas sp. CC4]CAA6686603.1 Unannotated [Lentimonas sp. CC6]CAA6691153.1 Unannotated [Lentimonas sp. CC10]CAA6693743.1 Unannotated [Lentimonas sp. CC19]CAA7070113.1 Unannotated [Lentimonas sp. CC11]